MRNFKNIVVTISLDQKSQHSLNKLQESTLFSQADNIYFVHIFTEKSRQFLNTTEINQSRENLKERITEKLTQLAHMAAPGHENTSGRPLGQCLFGANEKMKIIDFLKEVESDLVVSRTRGEQGIEGVFKSSFCFWLVEHAPCDVYIIRD
jgi:hypothetical protein